VGLNVYGPKPNQPVSEKGRSSIISGGRKGGQQAQTLTSILTICIYYPLKKKLYVYANISTEDN
jgi:hypothetical protein